MRMYSEPKLQRECMHDIVGEMAGLAVAHFNEISPFVGVGLQPDIEKYCAADDSGSFRAYTARINNKLVGYSTYVLCFNPHSMHSLQAHHDALFVLPECREHAVGARLIAYSDQCLQLDGVDIVYLGISTRLAEDMSPLLLAMKYTHVNTTFAKYLRAN